MTILALIAAGVVENVILGNHADYPASIDVSAITPRPAPGWTFDGESFHPPIPVEAPAPALGTRKITNLAFDLRFTTEERVAIEMASLDDPTAPLAQRQQAAEVRVSLQRANKAGFTDLDDPVTRVGVEQFELVGLIAPDRSAAILDGLIEERERYA